MSALKKMKIFVFIARKFCRMLILLFENQCWCMGSDMFGKSTGSVGHAMRYWNVETKLFKYQGKKYQLILPLGFLASRVLQHHWQKRTCCTEGNRNRQIMIFLPSKRTWCTWFLDHEYRVSLCGWASRSVVCASASKWRVWTEYRKPLKQLHRRRRLAPEDRENKTYFFTNLLL